MPATAAHPLDASTYDALWRELDDFVRYHPGARHRRRIVRAMLQAVRARSALDVGCGNGEGLLALRAGLPHVRAWHGADFAPECVAATQRRLPDVRVHRLDLEREALGERFELVICCEVLEHLRDRRAAFAHLAQMLAPGGHLLVTVPAGRVFATERHFGHVAHFEARELRALGADHGLRLGALREWGFPFYRALKHATNVNPRWALRRFARGRYGPCQQIAAHLLYGLCFADCPIPGMGCQLFARYERPLL